MSCRRVFAPVLGLALVLATVPAAAQPRARTLGLAPGVFTPGPHNAITDVAGVRVGHATITLGDSIRTGVTAIVPHGGDLYRDSVPAALHVGNGFGKRSSSGHFHLHNACEGGGGFDGRGVNGTSIWRSSVFLM